MLTCRGCFSVDGGRGGDEGREEEGAQRALGEEGRALGARQVLAAAHAAVDLKVQGLGFLLGSEEIKEDNVAAVETLTHFVRQTKK